MFLVRHPGVLYYKQSILTLLLQEGGVPRRGEVVGINKVLSYFFACG